MYTRARETLHKEAAGVQKITEKSVILEKMAGKGVF